MHRINKAHRAQSIAQYDAVRKKKLCSALCILRVGLPWYRNVL
jgi:hypothetical protein